LVFIEIIKAVAEIKTTAFIFYDEYVYLCNYEDYKNNNTSV